MPGRHGEQQQREQRRAVERELGNPVTNHQRDGELHQGKNACGRSGRRADQREVKRECARARALHHERSPARG